MVVGQETGQAIWLRFTGRLPVREAGRALWDRLLNPFPLTRPTTEAQDIWPLGKLWNTGKTSINL